MHFFPAFHEKSLLSCPYFVKKRQFSKKHSLMPIFCQKNIHSQIFCALISFFRIFMKRPLLLYHILSKKLKKLLRFFCFYRVKSKIRRKLVYQIQPSQGGGGWGCKKGRVFKINRTVGIYSKYKIPRDSMKYNWGSNFRVPK